MKSELISIFFENNDGRILRLQKGKSECNESLLKGFM